MAKYGRCDVLVHSAATFDLADLINLDSTIWRHVMAVNVESVLWLAQAFVPAMAQRGFGRIIFVVSDTIWSPPGPAMLPYVASKGALIGVMRTLAVSLGDSGISVSAVAPGLTDTPGSRTANTEADFDAVVGLQALNRRLTPDDTAAAIAYLASDEGAAMTGQVLCLDGGLILR
jgi:3-oxoacyl-[acyl-carrier protein] reductase